MKKYSLIILLLASLFPAYTQDLTNLENKKQAIIKQYYALKKEIGQPDKRLVLAENNIEKDAITVSNRDTVRLRTINEGYKKIQIEIYGEDDRKEITVKQGVYQLSFEKKRQLAKGVCAIIPREKLKISDNGKFYTIVGCNPNNIKPNGCTLDTKCPNSKFDDQCNIVIATGFIISKDRIITANHVFSNDVKPDMNKFYLVIDYVSDVGMKIDVQKVFTIEKTIDKMSNDIHKDFIILKVNRPFPTENLSLKINATDNIVNNQSVFMIGFPSGLPMKLADNAKVYLKEKTVFYTNLDAFTGNSGSPVFNINGDVEGILISGARDYVDSSENCCKLTSYSNEIERNSESEKVLRLQFITATKYYLE